MSHCAGWEWDATEGEVGGDIMGERWTTLDGLPEPGTLKNILVIRPALLVDGDAKGVYRVAEDDIGGWTVRREDVAHFVVEGALGDWEKWQNKCVSIAY